MLKGQLPRRVKTKRWNVTPNKTGVEGTLKVLTEWNVGRPPRVVRKTVNNVQSFCTETRFASTNCYESPLLKEQKRRHKKQGRD